MDKKTIAGYTIEKTLGEGGMGVVYRATDPTLDRPLAVKVIRRGSLSVTAKERFLREARASSRINHPNIITVYAAGEEDGHPYLAMEFVDGRTLREIIDEGPIPSEKALSWIIDILDALSRLHEEGIVHRDLKPENVMVTTEGVVKLMDFGIAQLATSETLTQEGTTLGTVFYMSPEQAAGKKVDARSDVFSIGAVLYQMLTGTFPFEGEHAMAVLYSITNTSPKPLTDYAMGFARELQGILDKALAKDRENRYPDAAAFRDDLRQLREREFGPASGVAKPSLKTRLLQIGLPVLLLIVSVAFIVTQMNRDVGFEPNRDLAVQHNELGQSALDQGDIEEARDEFRQAIVADPNYEKPWNNLGHIALNQGNLEEADSLFRRAVAIDSTDAAALHNLASVRWDLGDREGAEPFFRDCLRADSTLLAGYNNLGALLLDLGRPEEADSVLSKGLVQHPDHPYLLKNKGLAMQKMGEDDLAIDYWLRAIERDSTFVDARKLAAEWYERHARPDEARPHWEFVARSAVEEDRRIAEEALERLPPR